MPKGNPQPWFRENRNTWYVTIDGVQHNLRTADKSEAFDRWHKMMSNRDETRLPTAEFPVANVLALFAEYCEKHNSKSTYEWYRRFLHSFLRTIPKTQVTEQLRPFHVTRWLDANQTWGASSRRGAITALKRAFNWAIQQGYLEHSPIATIQKPRETRRETTLTNEQRQLIFDEAGDQNFRDLLILIQETGCRPQEVRCVEARHVELQKELWVFPVAENKTGDKTGKSRVVYLTPKALEVTRRLVKLHPTGALLRNSKGEPWTRNAIRCRFRRLRKRLADELPADLCLYLYRHTFATDGLERGVDPVTLSELMGHADATTVSRVYQHVASRTDHMRKAALRVTGHESASSEATNRQEPE